ncbi:MAG: hypothetical protein GY940_36305, partial [bacterium]|nr:hypothetical protein [bacterium]
MTQRESPVYKRQLEQTSLSGGIEEDTRKAVAINRRTHEGRTEMDTGKMLPDKVLGVGRDVDREFADQIEDYMDISILFPTTLYFAASREVSSRGFLNLYNFYRFAALKQLFDRVLLLSPHKDELELHDPLFEFIGKAEKNIFYGRSWVPEFLGWLFRVGLALLLYRLILGYFAHRRFMHSLSGVEPGFALDTGHLSLPLGTNEKVLVHAPESIPAMVGNRLTGYYGRAFEGELTINGEEMKDSGQDGNILVDLPDPDRFPGNLKVRT